MGLGCGIWRRESNGWCGVCLVLEYCRESCGCPHTALLHISPPNLYTTLSIPHLPPTAYAPLATSHSHHLAQNITHHTYPTIIPPNSTPAPTLLPTLDYTHNPRYTIPPTVTPYPLTTRPTPTLKPNPSNPPYPLYTDNRTSKPSSLLLMYATPPQRRSSALARHTFHYGFVVP